MEKHALNNSKNEEVEKGKYINLKNNENEKKTESKKMRINNNNTPLKLTKNEEKKYNNDIMDNKPLYKLLFQKNNDASNKLIKNYEKKFRKEMKKQKTLPHKFEKKIGKSAFIKISQDIYSKFKYKPNKEVRDINKMEEEAYNSMTSDPYIKTYENRKNVKNIKIAKEFLISKAKEDTLTKIGIENDRTLEMKKILDQKRDFSISDRNSVYKSARNLNQVSQEIKVSEKKNKQKKQNVKNKQQIKGNILPPDSTYDFSNSKQDFNQQNNADLDSEPKTIFDLEIEAPKNDIDPKTIIKEDNIIKNAKLNNKKYKKKEENLRESNGTNNSKSSSEKKELKFIKLFKEVTENIFDRKIYEKFDVNFCSFLLILYEVGFTNKNYSNLIYSEETEIINNNNKEISDMSVGISNSNISQSMSKKDSKYKNSNVGKSLEDEVDKYENNYKFDKEFQLSKQAWKILTGKQKFNEKTLISIRKVFLFFISVLGLYNDEQNGKTLKKNCSFFFEERAIVQQFKNINKYIYKYFGLYKNNAIENVIYQENKKRNNNKYNNSNSFIISNMDNSDFNEQYNIIEKKYQNKLKTFSNINSKNFIEEIKDNNFFKDGYSQSIVLTESEKLDNNNMNISIDDNDSLYEFKILLSNNHIEKKVDNVEFENLDVLSFLEEDKQQEPKKNEVKNLINSYTEIKSYIQEDEKDKQVKDKKKINYVFEIKIENEPKKLIMKKGDNKSKIIQEFCKEYGLDEIEKGKLSKIIDEHLIKLNYEFE